MKLSVNISTDNDGCPDGDNIGFLRENFFGLSKKGEYFFTECFDLWFWDGFAIEDEINLSIDNTMINDIFWSHENKYRALR